MIRNINYFFQSLIVYFFFFIGRFIGLRLSRIFFSFLFSLIGPIFKSKKIVNKNLNSFNPNITEIDKNKIIKSMWNNYGMTFVEYIFLGIFRKNNNHMIIKGEQNISNVLSGKKPVIFISGHFANFELMSMEITKKNINLATIYRPLNNIFLNPFMEYLRKKYICKNQIKKGFKGVREAINYLKNNNSIALMIDQRVSEGDKIDFFNKPALTTTLPAQLAFKYKINIIPVYIERKQNGLFEIEFQKEIEPGNFKNKFDLTFKLNKILENMIIKNPGQWIWTHDRWK